jgi:hypothetical protein
MKIRKIDKLLRYKLNRRQRRYLFKKWLVNWCGGKWWFNFSTFINESIVKLKWYLSEFYTSLWNDIQLLCFEHDIDFTLWWSIWDFRKANFLFAYKIFKLLAWKKLYKSWWLEMNIFFKVLNILPRLGISFVIYILLNRHWKEFFNFWKKKNIEDLFINYPEVYDPKNN